MADRFEEEALAYNAKHHDWKATAVDIAVQDLADLLRRVAAEERAAEREAAAALLERSAAQHERVAQAFVTDRAKVHVEHAGALRLLACDIRSMVTEDSSG